MKTKLFMAASTAAILFATGAMAQASITVTNSGEVAISELRVGGSSDAEFGDNLLSDDIAPGAAVDVTFPEGNECEQDIRAIYEDGDYEDVYNIDLCAGEDFTVVDDDVDEEDPEEEDEDSEDEEDDGEDEEEEEDEEDEEEEEEDEEEEEEDEEEEEEDEEEEEEDEEEEAEDEEEEE